ncbi:MAG: biopolymer transporter ExbD [Verrucomicrobiota bacterium]
MEFINRRRPRPNVPIISLIDILAILLIFFILTTTFKERKSYLPITLPSVTQQQAFSDRQARVTLAVSETGDLFLDGVPLNIRSLPSVLKGMKETRPDLKLELKADEETPLRLLIAIWGSFQQAGIEIDEVPARIQIDAPE